LALCGIVFVNIVGITGMPTTAPSGQERPAVYWVYETVLHQRFFPIFSFLFGLSSALFLRAATERAGHPRLVLLARLGFLIPIGLLHGLLQPQEVLLPYAVVGVLVLLPASFLPRRVVLALGVVATVAALAVAKGGSPLIPGLFLLGLATAQYGIPETLERRRRQVAVAFAVSLAAAGALSTWQVVAGATSADSVLPAVAGIVSAVAYTMGLVLIVGTRVYFALRMALEPLGRMALTNYLTASVLVVAANQVLRLGEADTPRFGMVAGLGAAILVLQVGWSRWWQARFHHGPAEWAWRCLTWWQPIPNAPAARSEVASAEAVRRLA
jgi:uncharacterized membrane protein YeiB